MYDNNIIIQNKKKFQLFFKTNCLYSHFVVK
nr:MAG TPA: hypothetical protein [Caudoviricetes sp.]